MAITNFSEIFNLIIGIILMILVFSLAYAYLKPHRIHRKYPVSTMSLKISYLVYLLVLLIIIYVSSLLKGGMQEVFLDVEFFAFLLILFVPTAGIFIRKISYFSKKRRSFYYFITLINIICAVALILMYFV